MAPRPYKRLVVMSTAAAWSMPSSLALVAGRGFVDDHLQGADGRAAVNDGRVMAAPETRVASAPPQVRPRAWIRCSGTAGQDPATRLPSAGDGRDAQVVAGAEFTGDGGGGVTDAQQRPAADDVESYVGADRPIRAELLHVGGLSAFGPVGSQWVRRSPVDSGPA